MAVQERGIRTRNELIRAAAVVFDEHGFAGGSTSMILKATDGVVQGSLYFHFPTKRHIAAAVMEQSREVIGVLLTAVRTRTGSPLGALIEFAAQYSAMLASDVMARAGFRLALEPSPMTDDARTDLTAISGEIAAIAAKAAEEGELKQDLDPKAVADLLVHQFVGVQQLDEVVEERKRASELLANSWRLLLPAIVPADQVAAGIERVSTAFAGK